MLLIHEHVSAQTPLIERYNSEDVPQFSSVFFIHQDKQGYMYISSGANVYLYNGKTWTTIKGLSSARCGVNDDDGTVLIGNEDGLGYLEVQPDGRRKYISLLDQLTEDEKKMPTIWHAHKNNEGIFFQGQHYIFQFKKINGKYKKIKSYPHHYIVLSFSSNNNMFYTNFDTLSEKSLLQTIKNEQVVTLFQYQEEYIGEVHGVIEKADYLLLFSQKNGIYRIDKQTKKVQPLNQPVNKILQKSHVYIVKELSENRIAVGTTYNGLFILSSELEILHHIHEGNGLSANNIHEIMEDSHGNIWLGLGSALNKVKLGLPVTVYNHFHNLKEKVYDVLIHEGVIYAATNIGLFYYNKETEKFVLIEGTKTQCWQLRKYGKGILLAGGNKGVFYIENKKVIDNFTYPNACFATFSHKKDSTLLIVATYGGVQLTRIKNNKFNYIGIIDATEADCRKIAIGEKYIWVSSSKGLFRLEIPASIQSTAQIKDIKVENIKTVPSTKEDIIKIQVWNNMPLIIGKKNYYTYNENNNSFEVLNLFENSTIQPNTIYKTANEDIWILYKKCIYKPREKRIDSSSLVVIPKNINNVYEYPQGVCYLSCHDGIYKFETELKKTKSPFHTFISKIAIEKDSLLPFLSASAIKIAYKYHNITFHLGASHYTDEYQNKFQFKLEGFDEDWSTWQKIYQKEYTNLREGKYTFRVRAMNAEYEIGTEASFSFTILPPWYRTIWAYGLYIILFLAALYVFARLYTQKLKKDKERLEKIVQERTMEIKQKNTELEQQKEEISAIAENLKIVNDEILNKNALLQQQKEEISAIAENLKVANEEIYNQKDVIEKQNKELKESINYAKRIQTAVIPSEEHVAQILNPDQCFVFYKPRDIVSGDFYWIADKKDKYILSVTDCTGHGVPGAFMSLIGDSLLNRIINDYEIHAPHQILQELHKGIFSTLHQQETQVRDSMDSIICTIDKKNHQIQLSSNENSVYMLLSFNQAKDTQLFFETNALFAQSHIRIYALTSQQELYLLSPQTMTDIPLKILIEIKGESTYTSHQDINNFNSTMFTFEKLVPSVYLYLMSDGLQDQFGGTQGKKFGLNNIRKLLFSCSEYSSIFRQKTMLENTFQQWIGNYEQTDDITVIGVKLTF